MDLSTGVDMVTNSMEPSQEITHLKGHYDVHTSLNMDTVVKKELSALPGYQIQLTGSQFTQ